LFFEDMVSFQGSPSNGRDSAPPDVTGAGDGLVLSLADFGERGQTLTVECRQGPRIVHLVPARKGEPLVREFPDVGVGISTLKESLYSDAILYVAGWERDVRQTPFPRDALNPVTSAFRLGPESVALKGSIEIRFVTGRSVDGREAVYRFDERKSAWSYRSSFVRGDTLAAFVRQPGVYAVFVDSIAPRVGTPRVEVRRSHATGEQFREIVIGITDEGSGLDVEALEVYLNGNKQIARWDGFSEKTFVLIRNQNIIGLQDCAISAVDRVGNASKLNTQIHIPVLDPKESGVETDGNAP
jgi:hypothetical protein